MLSDVTSNATIDTNGYLEFCAVIIVAVFDVKGANFKVVYFFGNHKNISKVLWITATPLSCCPLFI